MPHLVSNLVEKGFTPYTARMAPRHLWSKPTIGKSFFIKGVFFPLVSLLYQCVTVVFLIRT